MANWEREIYAVPGDIFHWPHNVTLSRPFFYNPTAVMLDDKEVAEVCNIKSDTSMLVVACFPNSRVRGAIVLVPNRGLWWWTWK